MKNLKVFLTIMAMGFSMAVFSQSNGVNIINETDCDYFYNFTGQATGSTNCTLGPSGPSGVVLANTTVFVPYGEEVSVHVSIQADCSGSAAVSLAPKKTPHRCYTCTATTAPNKVSLSTACCDQVTIKWGTNCYTEQSVITIL